MSYPLSRREPSTEGRPPAVGNTGRKAGGFGSGGDRGLACAPLFHIGGLNLIPLPGVQRGGTVHLMRSFDARAALDEIEEHRITSMFAVPAMLLFMSQQPDFARRDLSSLKTVICGGAPVPEPLIELYAGRGVDILHAYGLTETSPFCTLLPREDLRRKLGSAGLPPMYTEVRIVDMENWLVAPGTRGEIVARGPNIMKGYCGENVYPAEVEAVLYQMPEIAEAGVFGLPDPRWGERVVAVVVRKADAALTAEQILAFVEGKLARYKIPGQIEFVEALPRNPQGKVLKRVLREQFAEVAPGVGSPA